VIIDLVIERLALIEFEYKIEKERENEMGIMRCSYRNWVPKVQELKDENLDESHSLRNKI